MSEFEGYNGICPVCGQQMVQKWSASAEASSQEGCPWCGLACGTGRGGCLTPEEVWQELFIANRVFCVEQLRRRMEDAPRHEVAMVQGPLFPTIFNYSGDSAETLAEVSFTFPEPERVWETLHGGHQSGILELVVCMPGQRSAEMLAENHEACFHVQYLLRLAGEAYLLPGLQVLAVCSDFSLESALSPYSSQYSYSPGLVRLALTGTTRREEPVVAPAPDKEPEPELVLESRGLMYRALEKLRSL